MLPKKERLKREDFSRFFASGKRFHHPLFTLVKSHSPTFHASVVVSKKIAAKAVDRNKMRRRVYSVLERLSQSGGVYIILIQKEALRASTTELSAALAELVGQVAKQR